MKYAIYLDRNAEILTGYKGLVFTWGGSDTSVDEIVDYELDRDTHAEGLRVLSEAGISYKELGPGDCLVVTDETVEALKARISDVSDYTYSEELEAALIADSYDPVESLAADEERQLASLRDSIGSESMDALLELPFGDPRW